MLRSRLVCTAVLHVCLPERELRSIVGWPPAADDTLVVLDDALLLPIILCHTQF
jgi:hypothetical protein